MKIIYQRFNNKVESTLVNFLRESGHDVCLMGSNELLQFLESYCELEVISSEDLGISCVIISVEDTKSLDDIISILSSPYNYRRPRVILLSSLLTWAGRHHEEQIEGNATDFHSRVPAVYAAEQYLLENKFYSMAYSLRADACILGIGLVYGRDGFDLEKILSSLWSGVNASNTTQILSMNKGKNKVPMIHIDDLSNLLLKLIECTTLPSIFYPVTDKSNASIDEIFTIASKFARSKFIYSSEQVAVEAVLDDPSLFIWLGSFPSFKGPVEFIDLKYASGLSKSFEIIWKEFLVSHFLLPCSIVVAGPPKSLKTKLAQSVATLLELQYVEVVNCVKYVLTSEKEHIGSGGEGGGGGRSDSNSNIHSERSSKSREKGVSREKEITPSNIPSSTNVAASEATIAVKNRVLKALEAARTLADGGKAKSKTKVEETIDPKTLIITDALCRTIPAHLVRQCIGATLRSDLACTRKGFVLDVWDWAVQGLGDIRQVMEEENIVSLVAVAEVGSDPDQRPGSSQNRSRRPSFNRTRSGVPGSAAGKSFAEKGASSLSPYPELLVELQCPDAVTTNRLLCALMSLVEGSVISPSQLNKMSKDNQAILKAFEVTQATYNTLLQSALHAPDNQNIPAESAVASGTGIVPSDAEVEEAEFPASSHQGVVEIQRSGLFAVRRLDTSNATNSSIDTVAYQLITSFIDIHGKIGWLKEIPPSPVNATRGSISYSSKSTRKSTTGTPLDISLGTQTIIETGTGGLASVPGSALSSNVMEMFPDENVLTGTTTDHPSNELEEPARVNPLDHINKNLVLLETKDQRSVMDHCNQYQRYLVVNVLPHLADGMVHVAREMPEDPILFLANFLRERGVRLEEDTKANALEKFKDALSLAEEMDREILSRN